MTNIATIESTLRNELRFLKDKYKITPLGVFGSYVRHEKTQYSDIDILFDYDHSFPLSIFNIIEIKEYLLQKLSHNVDIVSFNSLKKVKIRGSILKEVRFI